MVSIEFELGYEQDLNALYSLPIESSKAQLIKTIEHWFFQTLERDGYTLKAGVENSVKVKVTTNQKVYSLALEGPESIEQYATHLTRFLNIGREALKTTSVVKKKEKTWPNGLIPKANNRMWDPQDTGKWQFFMPLGMAMLNHKVINFFHYPPIRLLDPMKDYFADPVPVRLIELMMANGLSNEQEAWLYSTVMDCAPIAAPDDQGTQYIGEKPNQQTVHLLPIDQYTQYQQDQVNMLLCAANKDANYTIPIVVYGSSARRVFSKIYLNNKTLPKAKPIVIEVIKGFKTAVIGADHPYRFFAQAQTSSKVKSTSTVEEIKYKNIDNVTETIETITTIKVTESTEVGLGYILPEQYDGVRELMIADLCIARWQVLMGKNPSRDVEETFKECEEYWLDKARFSLLDKLIEHQGSLYYDSTDSLDFSFKKLLIE